MTTTPPDSRPADRRARYWGALAVFGVVLTGYVMTLAPSVTFWDAGELIAASKILGIPHPPGTPLFVMIANVWGKVVAIGEFAYRTNLMTAVFSAASSGLFFLLVVHGLAGWEGRTGAARDRLAGDRVFVLGGAAAAALISAFTFTTWQNSNETEVYMVAALSIAAICWLAGLWRAHRGGERAPHVLLLITYLCAVSIGNHLLTLLVGPALFGFMWHVLRTEPLDAESDRAVEWAQWRVMIGLWVLLVGVGLGKGPMIAGAVAFLFSMAFAARAGAGVFALSALAIALVGASTYGFLYLRAQLGPIINEADPSNLDRLLSVIWREQYPPRSPIDNPIYTTRDGSVLDRVAAFLSCLPALVDQPAPAEQSLLGVPRCYTVRSIPLMVRQVQNYLQYFDWQWANGVAWPQPAGVTLRLPFTMAFIGLGMFGASVLRQRDRSMFWLLILLFLTTGPGLVGYMNFKPGFSLGWETYPGFDMHEVRERDYFFTVSFQVWGLLSGIGLAGVMALLRDRLVGGGERSLLPASVLGLALLPLTLNWGAASRRHGPDALLARDFAYDFLQSIEPYGIVFTNGDNDTFPLWYIQEVEGVRQDVTVVNLSLGNTDWYIRQLRDNPVRRFDGEQSPWFAPLAPAEPPGPLHSMTDDQIASLQAQLLQQETTLRFGRVSLTLPANSAVYVKDVLILRLLQENWNKRPVYFGLTSGDDNWSRFAPHLTQEGLVFRLHTATPPDSTRLAAGLFGVPIDIPRTDSLAWSVYRYAGLLEADTLVLDPTSRSIAINLSYPFYGLGNAYETVGDVPRAIENLKRGYQLQPVPEMGSLITAVEESLRAVR